MAVMCFLSFRLPTPVQYPRRSPWGQNQACVSPSLRASLSEIVWSLLATPQHPRLLRIALTALDDQVSVSLCGLLYEEASHLPFSLILAQPVLDPSLS